MRRYGLGPRGHNTARRCRCSGALEYRAAYVTVRNAAAKRPALARCGDARLFGSNYFEHAPQRVARLDDSELGERKHPVLYPGELEPETPARVEAAKLSLLRHVGHSERGSERVTHHKHGRGACHRGK